MAFNAPQYIDNLQLEGLIFIPPGNTPVSSQNALFINSVGQTYWSPALDYASLTAFSTNIYTYINTYNSNFSTNIQNYIDSNDSNLSKGISTLQSTLSLQSSQIAYQSTQISTLFGDFSQLSTTLYLSTTELIYSTFLGLSTYTSFSSQITALEDVLQSGLSTLSTTIGVQNASTYASLTTTINKGLQSTVKYVDCGISTLYTSTVKYPEYSTFSSIITRQLISTATAGLTYITQSQSAINSSISTLVVSTNQNFSSIKGLETRVSSLEGLSTNLSTISHQWISSFVSTSQSLQNNFLYATLSTDVGYVKISTIPLFQTVSSLSSALTVTNSNVSSLFSTTNSLVYNFNLLTTSSLIAGIYDSFIQLEQYSYEIIANTYNVVLYSTTVQNQSISDAFYQTNSEAIYQSTLSTVIPSTQQYMSSLISTLYFSSFFYLQSTTQSTIRSTLASYNTIFLSSISSTTYILTSTYTNVAVSSIARIESSTLMYANSTLVHIEVSTTTTYNNYVSATQSTYNDYVSSLLIRGGLSTLYTSNTIYLNDSNFVGDLDFINFRNFDITVYNIVSNPISSYKITYNPNTLGNCDYIRGFISINVSTPTSAYTKNDGRLLFNVYQWGIPTTVWGDLYPTISSANYMLHYEYTILRKTVYANLLNVYPKIAITSMNISSIIQNVFIDSVKSYTNFMRGTPLRVSWTNYSYFPFGLVGAPPFNPSIMINTIINGNVMDEFGPYALQSTNAVIYTPYVTNDVNPVQTTTISMRIIGLPDEYQLASSIQTVMPKFDTILLSTGGATVLGGSELVMTTDKLQFPIFSSILATSSTNYNPIYDPSTLKTGLINTTGYVGASSIFMLYGNSSIVGGFVEDSARWAYPSFYVNLQNYFDNLFTLSTFGSQTSFTFSNVQASYTLSNATISNVSGFLYRIYDPLGNKPFNSFSSNAYINYQFTTVPNIQNLPAEQEFRFNTGSSEYIQFTNLQQPNDACKQLLFYNIKTPDYNLTRSSLIVCSFSNSGHIYTSTLRTSGLMNVETFRF